MSGFTNVIFALLKIKGFPKRPFFAVTVSMMVRFLFRPFQWLCTFALKSLEFAWFCLEVSNIFFPTPRKSLITA